ncbi:MAG: Gfo/Idh/MocA family oxidoreductase [Actinobacteria bacterium]|nr:MAG: Gfo/Idh/MocA family oxidoreductase [Actinomycetota bacterium]
MDRPRMRFERSPLGVGVVGLGYWGPNLLRGLMELPDVEVRYICDLDQERLSTLGRRCPSATATDRYEELLGDPQLAAIVIATPVFTHFELAAASLQADKHTFVEKPFAPSTAQASELIGLAEARDLRLMCGQTFLYSPPVREVKRLIDTDELGDIFFVSSSRVNLGLHQRDVSVIWDLGPHDFSILLHWLEEMPESITAVGRDSIVPGIHDVAFMTMQFPSGILANVELSWLAPSKLRRTAIVGSNKMVVYEDGTAEPVRVFDRGVEYRDPETFGEYQLSYRSGDIRSPMIPSTEPLVTELAEFVRLIRTRETSADLELARHVVMLVEAAESSLAGGGVPVAVATGASTQAPIAA